MTKINLSASQLRRQGQNALATITGQDGVYEVVHGSPCPVCEANAVRILRAITGEVNRHNGVYELSCEANGETHRVTASAEFVVHSFADTNDFVGLSVNTPLNILTDTFPFTNAGNSQANENYANSFWPSAAVDVLFSSTGPQGVFYEETISSTLGANQFVCTSVEVPGVFLAYAGTGHVAAGYMAQPGPYQVTLFSTPDFSSDYLDAAPFHQPTFSVETTNSPKTFGQWTTQPVRLAATSYRLGALDRHWSAQSPSAPVVQDRSLPPCDHNAFTLKQRAVERHIFRDSPRFNYDTAIEMQLLGSSHAFSLGSALLSDVSSEQLAAASSLGLSLGLRRAHDDSQATLSISAVSPISIAAGTYVLRHSLADGRKTLPSEWHFAGNSQIQASTHQAGIDPTPTGAVLSFATEAAAIEAKNNIENSTIFSGSYFQPSVSILHQPKRAQFRALVDHDTRLPSDVARISIAYRFTAIATATIRKHKLELRSATIENNPLLALPWRVVVDYGYSTSSEVLFDRSYLHESAGLVAFQLSSSQWRNQAMAGQFVEVTGTGGVQARFRLIAG